jgi:glutathione synthase/RimK-type ligase-like ATP-grasp enzyme
LKILVLGENKEKIMPYLKALKEKEDIQANYIRILKFALVSKHKKSLIKTPNGLIDDYDAIFIQARLSLCPFIEPLLAQLVDKKIYVNCKPNSYYTGLNEILTNAVLANNKISHPKTFITGNEKILDKNLDISYPLIVKTLIGKQVQQSMIVNNKNELNLLTKSMKNEIDCYILKEFIKGKVVSCIVIGDKTFGIKQTKENQDTKKVDLNKGQSYKLNDKEKELVISVNKAIGYDISTIHMVNGKIISVSPIIELEKFNKICSENIEKYVTAHFIEKIKLQGEKKSYKHDLKKLGQSISNTIFGKILNKKRDEHD